MSPPTSEFLQARIRHLRNIERRSVRETAELVGVGRTTVRHYAPGYLAPSQGTRVDGQLIRRLRYRDGLTVTAVMQIIGCSDSTVRYWAPGYPGKIDNTLLRQAFDASGADVPTVARELGWTVSRRTGRHASGVDADGSRLRRVLGLQDDVSRGRRWRRQWIDAETACLIADVIGVPPDVVGATADLSHLAATG